MKSGAVKFRRGETQMKKRIGTRLRSLFEFPESSGRNVPYMELQGDMSLSVTGYETLLLYEEGNILFRMKPHAGGMCGNEGEACAFTLLRIVGHDLTICLLRAGCLCVRGRIDGVILHGEDITVGKHEGGCV